MDKFLKEKIINTTFEGFDKVIESEYKNHPNEKSYSSCRIQEGYNDYLKIVFRKGKINYFRTDFEWSSTPDEKINCEELKEIQRDDFVKEIVPEIKSKRFPAKITHSLSSLIAFFSSKKTSLMYSSILFFNSSFLFLFSK